MESTLCIAVDNALTPTITLLMDSGADCSLIKLHIPDPDAPVLFAKKVIFHVITLDGIPLLGRFFMELKFKERSYT